MSCVGLVLLQVKQLRMDKQVLAAHQAATSALKACREEQGLTVELVEDTLDAFAEVTRLLWPMPRRVSIPLLCGHACFIGRVERCAQFCHLQLCTTGVQSSAAPTVSCIHIHSGVLR